jgi:hypothetical protein
LLAPKRGFEIAERGVRPFGMSESDRVQLTGAAAEATAVGQLCSRPQQVAKAHGVEGDDRRVLFPFPHGGIITGGIASGNRLCVDADRAP